MTAYERPSLAKSLWQVTSTLGAYLLLWIMMFWVIRAGLPYWLCLPLVLVAACLLVRIFIFFHDCSHCNFFSQYWANSLLGYLFGILVFTPYKAWQRQHGLHHATYADLDARGIGDITTMTRDEYLGAPWLKRLSYRLYRNPIVMFCAGPAYVFLISQRIPSRKHRKPERFSILLTDLAVFAIIAMANATGHLKLYLIIQLPIILIAGAAGVWLFYVQHQFEGVYWARKKEWDRIRAALEGSSYYKLPKLLQWVSGNIGFHHVHHLDPHIPNYRLQECFDKTPELQAVRALTVRRSLRSLGLRLWDEKEKKLVGFGAKGRTGG